MKFRVFFFLLSEIFSFCSSRSPFDTCVKMEDELVNLNLVDEEEEAFREDASIVDNEFRFCLVGRCLIDSVVHFPSMQDTMVDLWYPIGGTCIADLGEKRYLYQFFIHVDNNRVLLGTPWFFNYHLLILSKILSGEKLMHVSLLSSEFWVQIHDLPFGLMSSQMAKQFGEFLWVFLEYDTKVPMMGI